MLHDSTPLVHPVQLEIIRPIEKGDRTDSYRVGRRNGGKGYLELLRVCLQGAGVPRAEQILPCGRKDKPKNDSA